MYILHVLECKVNVLVFWTWQKKHYKRQTMIECNHPKGGPFNPKSKHVTTSILLPQWPINLLFPYFNWAFNVP
jgi:hypothetical protein